jgi:hypothetical protein
MSLVLTNPALWIGATALAAPLVVHLLTRSTTRVIPFPSLVFLHAARASRSQVHKLRHWIMLLLRTLALAALLLAFLKPVGLSGAAAARSDPNQPAAVVVVLDVSASLDYREDGVAGFSRARAAAERVLRELPAGHQANLVLAGLTPRPSLPAPSANRTALARDLEQAAVTGERCDAPAALAEAVRELRGLDKFRKEIVLISDFQRSNWAAVDYANVPADVQLVFLPVSEQPMVNVALTELILQPSAPSAGEPVDVTCTLRNDTAEERSIPLRLRAGDGFEVTRTVRVRAGESASETIRLAAGQPGLLTGEAHIPDDALAADNTRYFAVAIGDRPRVTVLSDDAHPLLPLGRLLAAAVNPMPVDKPGPAFVVTARSRDGLGAALPGDQTLVLGGLGELDAARAGRLLDFLRQGGRALWFLHAPSDAAALAQLEKQSAGDFLAPYRVTSWRQDAPDLTNSEGRLATANFDHPALRRFRDAAELNEIRFHRRAVTERVNGAGQVLLRYRDGGIGLTTHVIGAGQLLVANFSPAPDASDLARRTLYLPLLHELLRSLRASAPAAEGCGIGAPCSTLLHGIGPQEALTCLDPDGKRVQASFALRGSEALVALPAATRAGLQRIESGGKLRGCVAVNLDKRESEAAVLSAGQLQELAAKARRNAAVAQASDLRAVDEVRAGRPLWPWALLLALGFLATEQALVHKWKR